MHSHAKTLCAIILAATATGCGSGSNSGPVRLTPQTQQSHKSQPKKFPYHKNSTFETKDGAQYDFNMFVYKNGAVLIDQRQQNMGPLIFSEPSPASGYVNVSPGDYFVLTDRVQENTRIWRYAILHPYTNEVWFEDLAGGTYAVQYTLPSATGVINVGFGAFGFTVNGWNERLSIDLNGDGLLDGESTPIIKKDGTKLFEKDLLQ